MSEIRDRVVELRRVRAGDLLEHPKNWRIHPERQRKALRGVMEDVGFADAILARERDDGALEVIDGHLRRSMDDDMIVPVLVLDVDADEADELLASLDPLAALAQTDATTLVDLLASIETRSEDLRMLYGELAREAAEAVSATTVDPEVIPTQPRRPRSRLGDLYVLGDHRIVCGDATDPTVVSRLMGRQRATLLVTDPPYGVSYVGKTRDRLQIAGDAAANLASLLEGAFANVDRVLKDGAAAYVFHPAGGNALAFLEAIAARWELQQQLVWVKDAMVLGHADYHYAHEPIAYARKAAERRRGRGAGGWYGGNARTTVFEIPRPKASPEHPTAKPVQLLTQLIANSSIPGDVVLDPFLGSGATLIACEELQRRSFSIEIDPSYVDVAVRRWERFTGRTARRYRKGGTRKR
jgi:DNA modification methylase